MVQWKDIDEVITNEGYKGIRASTIGMLQAVADAQYVGKSWMQMKFIQSTSTIARQRKTYCHKQSMIRV